MAQYEITDPQSGKTVTVEGGDTPPTQQEAEGIFAQAGLRGNTQQPQQQPSNPIMDFLQAASKPFRQAGQGIMDLGEAGGYGIDKYLLHDPNADQKILNAPHPFLDNQENQQALDHPVKTGAEIEAGLGSYAVPFGKGANLLTQVIAPGAVSGGLQAASEDITNPGNIVKGVASGAGGAGLMHGAGSLVNKAIEPVTDKLGQFIEKAGTGAVASQFAPAGHAITQADRNALDTLSTRYNLTNIDKIKNAASVVTGSPESVIHGKVLAAVHDSGPVDLGGIEDYAQQYLDHNGASITDTQRKTLTNIIHRGVANASVLPEGEIEKGIPSKDYGAGNQPTGPNYKVYNANGENTTAPGLGLANPDQTFKLIQDLGSQASKYFEAHIKSDNQGDLEYAQAAAELENTLKDRLFGGVDATGKQIAGKGADNQIANFTDSELAKLKAIHPQLAADAKNASNIGELRHIESNFTKPAVMAKQMSQKGQPVMSPREQMALGFSTLQGNPWLGLGYVAGSKAINSNAGKSMYGKTLINGGKALQKVNVSPQLQALLDLIGAKGITGLTQ